MEDKSPLRRYMLFLSLCHTIVIDQKKGNYNASSPDELALVNFAKQMGFEFKDRDINDNCIIHYNLHHDGTPEPMKYKLLNICEFNSTRKRQSCIFEAPDGTIILMCKGADSVLYELFTEECKNSEEYKET